MRHLVINGLALASLAFASALPPSRDASAVETRDVGINNRHNSCCLRLINVDDSATPIAAFYYRYDHANSDPQGWVGVYRDVDPGVHRLKYEDMGLQCDAAISRHDALPTSQGGRCSGWTITNHDNCGQRAWVTADPDVCDTFQREHPHFTPPN